MRLWVPHDPGRPLGLAAKVALALASVPADGAPCRRDAGLSVRMRFLHELPAGPLEVRPALPAAPRLLGLAFFWSYALEGVLWDDAGQIAELHVRREWARTAGLEVSL